MKEIKILMLVNIFCVAAMMAFLAVVGPVVRELGMEEWQAGATVSVAGIMWVFLGRYWGHKSDKEGRKKILLIGITGFAASYLALAVFIDFALLSPPSVIISFALLFMIRGIMGLFYSAIPPVSAALVADRVEQSQRSSYMARLGAASGLGMIVGPAIGGALASLDLSTPMYVAAILPMIAAIAVYFGISHANHAVVMEEQPLKILDPRLHGAMLAAFLTMFSIVTSQACLGFYVLDKVGLGSIESANLTGYILAAIGFSFIVAQIIVSKISTLPPKRWLSYGAVISAAGFIGVGLSDHGLFIGLCFSVAAFGMGFIYPAFQAMAADSVSLSEHGKAAGSVASAQGFGIIIGPLLSTFLYEIDPSLPFFTAAAAFLVLLAFTPRKGNI